MFELTGFIHAFLSTDDVVHLELPAVQINEAMVQSSIDGEAELRATHKSLVGSLKSVICSTSTSPKFKAVAALGLGALAGATAKFMGSLVRLTSLHVPAYSLLLTSLPVPKWDQIQATW